MNSKFLLFVPLPAKPTYNSKIERSSRVFREEFYADLSEDAIVGALRELMNFLHKYNSERPHASLCGLIHLEGISKYSSGDHFCLT
ncbi:MAG: integrase core domain-containing protein, partial [Alphaproteobacteria bacterium]|nr:integrase core domain-containing protein [Alphaproteobacteria bacterium]